MIFLKQEALKRKVILFYFIQLSKCIKRVTASDIWCYRAVTLSVVLGSIHALRFKLMTLDTCLILRNTAETKTLLSGSACSSHLNTVTALSILLTSSKLIRICSALILQ